MSAALPQGKGAWMKNRITHVVKRSGKRVLFNENKIVEAVWKAMQATGEGTAEDADEVMELVVKLLNKDFPEAIPSVEDVQDRVEQALMELGHGKVAKSYILYRNERAKLREQKAEILGGHVDELNMSINAARLLEKRYLLRDEEGEVTETPTQLFWRAANTIAMAELNGEEDPKVAAREFFKVMSRLEFLPSSPVLMNAGSKRKQLASSYVVPVEDDLEKIFRAVGHAALIHQAGGGTGFSFSRLRPRGDPVSGTAGAAAGPVAFMRVFEAAMRSIKQSGQRQGANIAVLRVDHPDILEFINLKLEKGAMSNFNLSVGITDTFMAALAEDREYDLIHPRTGKATGSLSARMVFDTIISNAWRTGDPGLLFLDRINAEHACQHLGRIEATNPCAEQPLLPYESACEGSINLVKFLKEKEDRYELDWARLRQVARTAVRLLDDVIDVNQYPVREADRMAKQTRKIGIGVMGFADLLYALRIPYASEQAVELAERLGEEIRQAAEKASEELAAAKREFPAWKGSALEKAGRKARNAALMGIAPTGSISVLADVSAGIEPNYALAYTRTMADGSDLLFVNPWLEDALKGARESMQRIAREGSIDPDDPDIPQEIKEVFVTTHQIPPEWHIRIQAAWQRNVDGGISKTINYPRDASITDIEEGFLLAWELGCKGITAYRDGSMDTQVLSSGGR